MATSPSRREARPASATDRSKRPIASNRRARHEYEFLDTFEAGISLLGTEVKAARTGQVQLQDAFVEFRNGEAYLVHAHIGPYSHGNRENHAADRPRKLLLKRREIDRLATRTQAKGLTVIPLEMFLRGPHIKLSIALAQGKKLWDKRETEKRREQERDAREAVKTATGRRR